MTATLIHNKEALSNNQDRYLVMVYEHWVSAQDGPLMQFRRVTEILWSLFGMIHECMDDAFPSGGNQIPS
jgi:hypothetical protein